MKDKKLGQVFTPDWVIDEILDSIDYKDKNVINKTIIDPSCGNGAFLKKIVDRIINFCKLYSFSIKEIIKILENSVYGIEIDETAFNECINNLNNLIKNKLNIEYEINWKIYKSNALIKYKDFFNFFDYVVGNPPYIRVHNLDMYMRDLLKKEFNFLKGTIDIYIAFFEIGFKILKKNGYLGYITSNSYLHNSSYINFRKYLKQHKALKVLIDFKSKKIFRNYSAYTAITIINFFDKKDFFIYKELVDNKIKTVNKINFYEIDDKDWSFSSKENMNLIITLNSKPNKKVSDFFDVQYGFATLRDKIYIDKISEIKNNLVLFNNHWIEYNILFKIVKGSTFKGYEKQVKYIIFPYKKQNKRFVPIPEDELKENYPNTYKYLLKYKGELLKRDIDKGTLWYEFGRSQGIQSCYNEKIVLPTLIKDKIYFFKIPEDIFVYSGIFIVKKSSKVSWDIIINILKSEYFYKYIQITGKNFSSGYKSITTKQIKDYPTEFINEEETLFS